MTKIFGSKPYIIKYLPRVLAEDIPALPGKIKSTIQKAIEGRLTIDPINLGKALRGRLVGSRRLRVGDYRIIYRINKLEHTVTITKIGHRDNIYKKLSVL